MQQKKQLILQFKIQNIITVELLLRCTLHNSNEEKMGVGQLSEKNIREARLHSHESYK